MIIAETIAEVRDAVAFWRRSGRTLAFVPTMGNLHAGHLSLIQLARRHADHVAVSIYVNPLQFGANEDFSDYPRTLKADEAELASAGADLLFLPADREMYSADCRQQTFVEVPGLSEELCGRFRPGHFRGVTTIVCKLLNYVQPDVLVLGEKDYQQLVIVRRMVAELGIPVEVIGAPTIRETSGLAMSSRNGYLSVEQRDRAAELSRCLAAAAASLNRAPKDIAEVEADAVAQLTRAGFRVDYVSVRRKADLDPPGPEDRDLLILAAAWLGKTRLIDNTAAALSSNGTGTSSV